MNRSSLFAHYNFWPPFLFFPFFHFLFSIPFVIFHNPLLICSMSTSNNIRYENVDWRALVNHEAVNTGGSRYFQWVGESKCRPSMKIDDFQHFKAQSLAQLQICDHGALSDAAMFMQKLHVHMYCAASYFICLLLSTCADWDGSASQRWRPTLFGSWPSWWKAGDECYFQ